MRPSEPVAYPNRAPWCVAVFKAPLRSRFGTFMNAKHPNGCILSQSGLRPYISVIGAFFSGFDIDAMWLDVMQVYNDASPHHGLGALAQYKCVRALRCVILSHPSALGLCCDVLDADLWWWIEYSASMSVKAVGKSGPLSVRHVSISVLSQFATRFFCLIVTSSHSLVIGVTSLTDCSNHSHEYFVYPHSVDRMIVAPLNDGVPWDAIFCRPVQSDATCCIGRVGLVVG